MKKAAWNFRRLETFAKFLRCCNRGCSVRQNGKTGWNRCGWWGCVRVRDRRGCAIGRAGRLWTWITGVGGTTTVVSKVTGSLTIQVLFDRLPINHLIQLQQWETVNVFGNHGLGGLLEEGTHGKSPKCLGGNLGDFWGILQRSHKGFVEKNAEEYKQKGRLKFSDGLFCFWIL